jgi:hypothetical protein
MAKLCGASAKSKFLAFYETPTLPRSKEMDATRRKLLYLGGLSGCCAVMGW